MNYFEIINNSLLHIIYLYLDYEYINYIKKIINYSIDFKLLIQYKYPSYNIINKINKDDSIIKYLFDIEYDILFKTLNQIYRYKSKNTIFTYDVKNPDYIFLNLESLDIMIGEYDLNIINYLYYIQIYKDFSYILKYEYPKNFLMYKFIYESFYSYIDNDLINVNFIDDILTSSSDDLIDQIKPLDVNNKYVILYLFTKYSKIVDILKKTNINDQILQYEWDDFFSIDDLFESDDNIGTPYIS